MESYEKSQFLGWYGNCERERQVDWDMNNFSTQFYIKGVDISTIEEFFFFSFLRINFVIELIWIQI